MPCRTAALIVQATTLHAEVAALFAQSRALIDCGRQRRHRSPLRVIRGGSDAGRGDAALVVSTITETRMCVPCIARHTGVPAEQVNGLLMMITKTFRLRIGPHR